MFIIIGFVIVIVATLGGFVYAGGNPLALIHVSEFIVIGGICIGVVVVSTPTSTIKLTMAKIMGALKGTAGKKEDYVELLKLLYEVFMLARRSGITALEDHVHDPAQSTLFQKYPTFGKDPHRAAFLCAGLKPLIDGRIKPEQVGELYEHEVDVMEEEAGGPVHVLNLVGDSLPGIGIVAAVLGIINTMASIADGPEAVGEKVAAALTGTFLGILGAYGFINPLSGRIKHNNQIELNYYAGIMKGVSCFAAGMAPIMAVELARRSFDHSVQPPADELEAMLKGVGKDG
jgi:chemotaxis protein MotA